MKELKLALKPGKVYFADNGRRICLDCAGFSAKYSGRDISGQRVEQATREDGAYWKAEFGEDLSCECGQVTVSSSVILF